MVRIGGRYVHLLKMFGALFTFGAAFGVLSAAYTLSNTLEVELATRASPVAWGDVLGKTTGPVSGLFIWLAFMVLGIALYRSDRTVFPIEEDVEEEAKTRPPSTLTPPRTPGARWLAKRRRKV